MDSQIWTKIHGATTHFPLALVLCSAACDAAGFVWAERAVGRDLQTAGYWAMLGGAVGSVPAVFSGIVMTRGNVLGHGALRWHHLFAWPAFALIVALATWRVCLGGTAPRRAAAAYLVMVVVTMALVFAAGYWGGELMMAV